ncbi:MAG: pyridoxamine 5'-phosphate oxidase family protein [Ignavibacteria bacterium]|nr:pyridoxamine 5'-phosphate oxidase family protein [Ignavibacteria bacterium]
MTNKNFTIERKNKITRLPKRGHYDEKTIHSILDEVLSCTIAFTKDGIPFQIPTIFCRIGNSIFIHGSVGAGYMRVMEEKNTPVNICVHILDGLVLARSAFHQSANYRSVVIFSHAKVVKNRKKIINVLEELTNRIHPKRWSDVREINEKEFLVTRIYEFPIESVSAKIRTGPPIDEESDYSSKYWAGVIPFETKRGKVIPDPKLNPKIKTPKYLLG